MFELIWLLRYVDCEFLEITHIDQTSPPSPPVPLLNRWMVPQKELLNLNDLVLWHLVFGFTVNLLITTMTVISMTTLLHLWHFQKHVSAEKWGANLQTSSTSFLKLNVSNVSTSSNWRCALVRCDYILLLAYHPLLCMTYLSSSKCRPPTAVFDLKDSRFNRNSDQ